MNSMVNFEIMNNHYWLVYVLDYQTAGGCRFLLGSDLDYSYVRSEDYHDLSLSFLYDMDTMVTGLLEIEQNGDVVKKGRDK